MKIISFNSYKGGACRTTTCFNTLPYLAKALNATSEEPILVYDIDLDSMGLTNLFHVGEKPSEERMRYSAKNLFVEDDEGINQTVQRELGRDKIDAFYGYHEKVGETLGLDDCGSVLFLGADRNAPTITDDDFVRYSDDAPIERFIRAIEYMKNTAKKPKAIVFDCASGMQMTTLTALGLADSAVVCMRPTYQFRVGTGDYVLNQIPAEINKSFDGKKREIVLLPTAVSQINVPENEPNRDEVLNRLNDLRDGAFNAIDSDIVMRYKRIQKMTKFRYTLNTDMFEDDESAVKGLPEIERFKWEETLLYGMKPEEMTEQERILQKQYEKLANILAR